MEGDYAELMLRGFYPAMYDRDIPPADYYPNYIETYVQRDVSELIAVQDMSLFRKFLALCATRAGQLLNMSAMAKELGVSTPTVKAWLSALESSYIIYMLQPYHRNFSKRIVKSPKLYFYDTGLLSHLLKINDVSKIENQSVKGALFENMMISEYLKQIYHGNERMVEPWFWRDSHGNEVDLLLDKPQGMEVIEVKATATVTSNLFKGLNYFSDVADIDNLKRTLVYGGAENQQREAGAVVSWRDVELSIVDAL